MDQWNRIGRNRTAQSAVEFIILIGFFLLAFTVIMVVIATKTGDIYREEVSLRSEDLVMSISREVMLATYVQDGYKRTFVLPDRIKNMEYTLILQGNEVVIQVVDDTYGRMLPNVTGTLIIGENVIEKRDGQVYLNVN